MIFNGLSSATFFLSFLFVLVSPFSAVKGHYLDKRQIGVLARTGALPQGKRSVEVLARNGELPILRNPKDTRQEETLNSLIKKSQGGETLDATYDREKEVGKLFQNENYGKRFSNDENDEDYNIQVEKKLSEIMSRSGYLIRPAQNGDKESLNLFDPQDLLGNEYRKKRGPYFAMSPEYQTVEESDESHSSSKSDNKENLIEKRFLGRIPQLGRTHQKVQSPSSRRRPHLRPSWL